VRPPNQAERVCPLRWFAYTGLYRVDGDKWITREEVAMNSAWVGAEQARAFQISFA
jgi:hypothetical protein